MEKDLLDSLRSELSPQFLVCNDSDICIISGYYQPPSSGTISSPTWLTQVKKNHSHLARQLSADYVFFSGHAPLPSKTTNPFYLGCNSKPHYILYALSLGYQRVFWIDSDSYSINPQSLLTLLKHNQSIIATGDESDIVNTGHLLFSNTEFSRNFLLSWIDAMSIKIIPTERIPFIELTPDSFCVGDQTTFNALLAGPVTNQANLIANFNVVNGWSNNHDRLIKKYKSKIAPFNSKNIKSAYKLFSPDNRANILIVTQRQLNSYLGGDLRGLYLPGDSFIHFTYQKELLLSNQIVRIEPDGSATIKIPLLILLYGKIALSLIRIAKDKLSNYLLSMHR